MYDVDCAWCIPSSSVKLPTNFKFNCTKSYITKFLVLTCFFVIPDFTIYCNKPEKKLFIWSTVHCVSSTCFRRKLLSFVLEVQFFWQNWYLQRSQIWYQWVSSSCFLILFSLRIWDFLKTIFKLSPTKSNFHGLVYFFNATKFANNNCTCKPKLNIYFFCYLVIIIT